MYTKNKDLMKLNADLNTELYSLGADISNLFPDWDTEEDDPEVMYEGDVGDILTEMEGVIGTIQMYLKKYYECEQDGEVAETMEELEGEDEEEEE